MLIIIYPVLISLLVNKKVDLTWHYTNLFKSLWFIKCGFDMVLYKFIQIVMIY